MIPFAEASLIQLREFLHELFERLVASTDLGTLA